MHILKNRFAVAPGLAVIVIVVVTVAVAIRISIIGQGLVYLDRMFLPDDTYYTLSVAKSLARGIGPSASSGQLTSGFQPLTAFIMTPFYFCNVSNDQGVYIAILISGFFGALACGLFAILTYQFARSWLLAIVAGLIAATSPEIIRNDLNGLETSLAFFCALSAIFYYSEYRNTVTKKNALILGIIIGLMLLSRIDTGVLALLIGMTLMMRMGWRDVIPVVLASVVVVAPWWIYCTLKFGSPIPESGAAIKQLLSIASDLYIPEEDRSISVATAIHLAAVTLMNSVPAILSSPGLTLFPFGVLVLLAGFCLARKQNVDAPALILIYSVILCLFYTLYLPAFWFFHRYLHPVYFAIVISILVLPGLVFYRANKLINPAILGLGLILVVFNIKGAMLFYSKPEATLYSGINGAKGYREIALEMLSVLPADAIIGTPQSGALGYYANNNIKVINLDGVVNHDAYSAIKDRTLVDYIARSKIDYLAGWAVNLYHIRLHSVHAKSHIVLQKIAVFKKQGNDQVALYKVVSS